MSKYIANVSEVPVGKIPGREIRDLVNGKTLGTKGISLRVTDVLPGESCYPAHIHTACEEVIFVLSGQGEIKIGQEVFPMRPGDAIYLPQDVPHVMRNTGREVMRLSCSFNSADFSRDLKNDETLRF